MNIINALPPSMTTDLFTEEGIWRSGFHLPQGILKSEFDVYFESEMWPRVAEEIRRLFGGEPFYRFLHYEGGKVVVGKGKRESDFGGYKIDLFTRADTTEEYHVGWIWFRPSGTERGVVRRGVSVSHWDACSPQAADTVKQLYEFLNVALTEALNRVEKRVLNRSSDNIKR